MVVTCAEEDDRGAGGNGAAQLGSHIDLLLHHLGLGDPGRDCDRCRLGLADGLDELLEDADIAVHAHSLRMCSAPCCAPGCGSESGRNRPALDTRGVLPGRLKRHWMRPLEASWMPVGVAADSNLTGAELPSQTG